MKPLMPIKNHYFKEFILSSGTKTPIDLETPQFTFTAMLISRRTFPNQSIPVYFKTLIGPVGFKKMGRFLFYSPRVSQGIEVELAIPSRSLIDSDVPK